MDILFYHALRLVHLTCVAVTFSAFVLRGFWMLRESPALRHPLTRTLPHINDTLLLASAVGMLWLSGIDPLQHAWLRAKLAALLVYILLGSIALRWGPTRGVRALAFIGALLTFGYLIGVALTRNPWPLRYPGVQVLAL